MVGNNVSSIHQRGQKFSHQCVVSPSLRHGKTQLRGVSCRFAFVKKRNTALRSFCSAVEDVDGAKNLIGFCLGRQSWAFLSDSAVHTITSNRLHWLEIHSSAPNLHVILSKTSCNIKRNANLLTQEKSWRGNRCL